MNSRAPYGQFTTHVMVQDICVDKTLSDFKFNQIFIRQYTTTKILKHFDLVKKKKKENKVRVKIELFEKNNNIIFNPDTE